MIVSGVEHIGENVQIVILNLIGLESGVDVIVLDVNVLGVDVEEEVDGGLILKEDMEVIVVGSVRKGAVEDPIDEFNE